MLIKLAIIDDDIRLAKALKSELLQFQEIESVYTSHSGLSFVSELEAMPSGKRPEVVIMDISMAFPDEGIQATQQIKSRFPEILVIIFTISDEDNRIMEAFKAGAMGYLLKDEKPEFILKTILDVRNGGAQMSPGIARKAISYFSSFSIAKESEKAPGPDKALTDRELEILRMVSEGRPYAEIGGKLFIATSTVKKHMAHIFEKLHVNNKTKAIREAEGLL